MPSGSERLYPNAAPAITPPSLRPGGRASPGPSPDRLEGRTLGKCRLLKRLGRGGMGDVYLAEHQFLQKRVAVKVLPPEMTRNDELLARFHREAVAAARLDHANLVHVHDVGEEDGHRYIVMQYVEGRNLQDILQEQKRVEPREAARICLEAARGLQAAHDAGIIHRDVKPANILVSVRGEVKLADFGLALDVDAKAPITLAGAIMGTPQFLSPEQADGRRADPRSDLYSLGVCLYTMVTGHRPFTGESHMSVLYKQLHEIPRNPLELDPTLPPALVEIVLRALEKSPERRYAKGEDLARDLERFLHGPAPTLRVPPVRRTARRRRGFPGGILLSGAAVAAVALALTLALVRLAVPGEAGPAPRGPAPAAGPPEPAPRALEGVAPYPLEDLVFCTHLNSRVVRTGATLTVDCTAGADLEDEPHLLCTRRNDLADFLFHAEVRVSRGRPEAVARMAYFGDPVEAGHTGPTRLPLEGLEPDRWVGVLMKVEADRLELFLDGRPAGSARVAPNGSRTGRCGFRLRRGQKLELRNLQLRVLRPLDPASLRRPR